MDISTLSKQLNMPATKLRATMKAAGFFVSPRANKIDNQLAKRVLATLGPQTPVTPLTEEEKEVKIPKVLAVKELAQILNLEINVVIKKLIENGVLASINEEIDYDTAAIVATDLGFNVQEQASTTTRLGLGYVTDVIIEEMKKNPSNFVLRAPVVAVMGHVDHGKTTLLDTIRNTKVVEKESGSITQHIGAYQVKKGDKPITFLDTPGHEAFSAMRARGANVTDIIVLVVAADDGIKPQTIEVINRAKITSTPVIVAINKVDKPDANVERVKKELSDQGLVIEEWGGMVPVANISSLTGQGVDELLDLVLLQADVMALKANPTGKMLGTVIESHVSKTQGSVATILVQNGTLNLSDIVAAGRAFGKIRTMTDASKKKIKIAGPSTPVLITGLSTTAEVGDILRAYESLEEARSTAQEVLKSERAKRIQGTRQMKTTGKDLNLIIKVDVRGSLEAINEALDKLKNSEIKINVLEEEAGEINENDVLRAATADAVIIGFHTRLSPQAAKLVSQKGVAVQLYSVIYELVEDLTKQVVDMMTPEVMRTDLGRAKILAVFRTEKEKMIVGGSVAEGKIKDKARVEIKRGDTIIGIGEITQLQQNKQETKEVLGGSEFGVSIKTTTNILEGDVLIVFEEIVKQKSL
ncbi:MAG: translation initiation factor IF-2 [bacterium]|nr:translation initiation factor IF-2 [bacterium]